MNCLKCGSPLHYCSCGGDAKMLRAMTAPTTEQVARAKEALERAMAWGGVRRDDALISGDVARTLLAALAAAEQAVAAEREACAKTPAGGSNPPPGLVHEDDPFSAYNRGWADGVRDLRAAIRERGKEAKISVDSGPSRPQTTQ